MYYNTKYTQKTKARFSRLLQHLAWKWRGPILVLALHKFVTYLLTQTFTHLLTALDSHGAISWFTRFCRDHGHDRRTDRQTTLLLSVAKGCI